MILENKKNHYHSIFSFQHSSPKSLHHKIAFDPQSFVQLL